VNRALLLLVLPLLAAVLACGGDGANNPGPSSPTVAGPVTIQFWHSEVASNQKSLRSLVDRFNSEQDQVRVNLVFQGNDEDTMNKLLASVGSDDVPALAYLAELHTQLMIDSGATTPIQDFVDRDGYDLSDIDSKVIDYYTLDGQLRAMPFAVAVPLLYYNKVPFREVGLDPDRPPADLEELRAASEKLLKRDSEGKVVRSGIALDTVGWYLDLTYAEHGDLFVDNENGRQGRATKALFDGPTGQAFFRWWHDMIERDLAVNVGPNPNSVDSALAVAVGRAVMAFGSSAALRSLVDALKNAPAEIELGATGHPGVPGGTGLPGLYTRALWISNERPQEEQEAAWTFVKWLLEPEQQAEWFAGSGYLPVVPAAYELEPAQEIMAEYPQFRVPVDLFLATPSTPIPPGPLLGPFLAVRNIVEQAMEEISVGGRDPDEALADAVAQANEEIERYNRRVGD
jgi:sn-glycerol 3-phosphate transport system substrate-binding protein